MDRAPKSDTTQSHLNHNTQKPSDYKSQSNNGHNKHAMLVIVAASVVASKNHCTRTNNTKINNQDHSPCNQDLDNKGHHGKNINYINQPDKNSNSKKCNGKERKPNDPNRNIVICSSCGFKYQKGTSHFHNN